MSTYSLLFALIVIMWVVMFAYNHLMVCRLRIRQAWMAVDKELKQRHELVPDLLQAVQCATGHGKRAANRVSYAHGAATAARRLDERRQAEAALTEALQGLVAVAEEHLHRSEDAAAFEDLRQRLHTVEAAIERSGRLYNRAVERYNTKLQKLPWRPLAQLFGFRPALAFVAEGQQEEQANSERK